MRAKLPLPPGRFGLPWIGETLSFLRDPDFALKRQQQYGSLFKSRLIGQPTVFFCGPEANAFLLSSHADCFSWRGGWPDTFKTLLGESFFLQEGAEHQRNRRLLMPAFHGKALEGYFSTMVALSDGYLADYDQPTVFDPDRFSPERAEQKRFDYSLVGFGGGPRICLGMAFAKLEMKILAALLLRRYQWQLEPDQNLTMNPIPSLRPVDGVKVTFQRLS